MLRCRSLTFSLHDILSVDVMFLFHHFTAKTKKKMAICHRVCPIRSYPMLSPKQPNPLSKLSSHCPFSHMFLWRVLRRVHTKQNLMEVVLHHVEPFRMVDRSVDFRSGLSADGVLFLLATAGTRACQFSKAPRFCEVTACPLPIIPTHPHRLSLPESTRSYTLPLCTFCASRAPSPLFPSLPWCRLLFLWGFFSSSLPLF